MLESQLHPDSCFVTLTYEEEKLPPGGTLDPKHTQRWLKYLRRELSPRKIRFFLVGEYGKQTGRPHYHAAIFGLASLEEDKVRNTWLHGNVHVGELTIESAQYIAKYVTKSLTVPDNDKNRKFREEKCQLLENKHPEFARMSLRPGIGADAMSVVAAAVSGLPLATLNDWDGDVPSVLMHGKKKLPLGRYLRRKLREKLGRSPDAPESALQKYGTEMRVMFEDAFKDKEIPKTSLKNVLVYKNKQKVLNIEKRSNLYNSKIGVL